MLVEDVTAFTHTVLMFWSERRRRTFQKLSQPRDHRHGKEQDNGDQHDDKKQGDDHHQDGITARPILQRTELIYRQPEDSGQLMTINWFQRIKF